jgi:hypothetical protein
MKQKILFVLFCLFFCINTNAQKIEKNIIISYLEISNNILVNMIDSLVLQKKGNSKVFYFLEITKDSINDIYVINIEKCNLPYTSMDESFKGYFTVFDTPIFVKQSCNPDSLFRLTDKKRQFNYFILKEYPPIIIEPSYWNFFYVAYDEIYFLNLPNELIRRWQFKPCK